jgi:hypothetical protein
MITPETVEKIRQFYSPEFTDHKRSLELNSPGKESLQVEWKKIYALICGAEPVPKSLDEARERGFPVLSGRELFEALLSPEEFEAVRATKEVDGRTAAYLEATKKGIGLVCRKDSYDHEKIETASLMGIGIGADGLPIYAEIGELADGRWSVQTDTEHRNRMALYFDHSPTAKQVEQAILIRQIETNLGREYHFNPSFRCRKCGVECQHWLDIHAENLEAKWAAFKERCCGC